jgi:hypothetical protein
MAAGFQITIDSTTPPRLATFWAKALPSYDVEPPPDGFDTWRAYWVSVGVPDDEATDDDWCDSLVSPDGPRVWFQEVPESKSVKNRIHFDLLVGGGRTVPIEQRRERVRTEASRLVELGATIVAEHDTPDMDHFFIAMTDPEDNEFDIV